MAMIFTYAPRTFDISTSPSWTSTTTKANAETKEKIFQRRHFQGDYHNLVRELQLGVNARFRFFVV